MALIVTAIGFAAICLLIVIWIKRTKDRRQFEEHSITPEALHKLLGANQQVLLFDVRQPLDLLAHTEIIAGAKRIPPKEVLENPLLIPKRKTRLFTALVPVTKPVEQFCTKPRPCTSCG